jgi:hypothetical protein
MQDHVFLTELDGFFESACMEVLAGLPGDENRDERLPKVGALFLSLFEKNTPEQRAAAEEFLRDETRGANLRYVTFVRDWTGAYA